jgi:hypothetical protein
VIVVCLHDLIFFFHYITKKSFHRSNVLLIAKSLVDFMYVQLVHIVFCLLIVPCFLRLVLQSCVEFWLVNCYLFGNCLYRIWGFFLYEYINKKPLLLAISKFAIFRLQLWVIIRQNYKFFQPSPKKKCISQLYMKIKQR